MPSEQRADPSAISQVNKGYHERLPNAATQQCSENNDVTMQSFSSIPSIKLRGQFGNVFVKPSAHFVLLNFLFFNLGSEKKLLISFLLNVLFTFRGFKMAEEKMSKFGSFDL